MVEYATTAQGLPIFSISTLSAHTADAAADARAALTVKTPAFGSLADARVTLQGKLRRAAPEEVAALRETYLKKHPNVSVEHAACSMQDAPPACTPWWWWWH